MARRLVARRFTAGTLTRTARRGDSQYAVDHDGLHVCQILHILHRHTGQRKARVPQPCPRQSRVWPDVSYVDRIAAAIPLFHTHWNASCSYRIRLASFERRLP